MFHQESSAFAYDLSYRPSATGEPIHELESIAKERVNKLVTAHREAESVRENALSRILPAASAVFNSLHQNHSLSQTARPVSRMLQRERLQTISEFGLFFTRRFRLPIAVKAQAAHLQPLAQRLLSCLARMLPLGDRGRAGRARRVRLLVSALDSAQGFLQKIDHQLLATHFAL